MIIKSKREMLERVLQETEYRIGVNATSPGSLMRTFVEVLTEEFYDFYELLEMVRKNAFLSSAEGVYADLIGELVNCERLADETDLAYKERIKNQVDVVAGGNETTVRLKALSVPGVADVRLEPFYEGPGSFACYVYAEPGMAGAYLLSEVERVLEDNKAYGISVTVLEPEQVVVDVVIELLYKEGVGASRKAYLRTEVTREIVEHLGRLGEEDLIINELEYKASSVDGDVRDAQVRLVRLNGKERRVSNVTGREDAIFVAGDVEVVG